MKPETLAQRIAKIHAGKAAAPQLEGLPFGSRAETAQAIERFIDSLPRDSDRKYSIHDILSALYVIDSNNRYRRRG